MATDHAGIESDQLTIEFEDSEDIVLPEDGGQISLHLGYGAELWKVGDYILDEVSGELGKSITIVAKGFDTSSNLKTRKSKIYEQGTIGLVIQEIAKEHGLDARIQPDIFQIPLEHPLSQENESDLNFLVRLSNDFDFSLKLVADRLAVVKRKSEKTASGGLLPLVEIARRDIIGHPRYRRTGRDLYGSVIAFYQDLTTGERKRIRTGISEPSFVINETFPSEAQALEAAKAKRKEYGYKNFDFSVTVDGWYKRDRIIVAESPVLISGCKYGLDGLWTAKSVKHNYRSRYHIEIDLERPRE